MLAHLCIRTVHHCKGSTLLVRLCRQSGENKEKYLPADAVWCLCGVFLFASSRLCSITQILSDDQIFNCVFCSIPPSSLIIFPSVFICLIFLLVFTLYRSNFSPLCHLLSLVLWSIFIDLLSSPSWIGNNTLGTQILLALMEQSEYVYRF